MPNGDVELGYQCKLKNLRWWETWFTVFPLHLGGNATTKKGFRGATTTAAKPYERLISTFHVNGSRYHWLVHGHKDLPKTAGLYRAADCNSPFTTLEFDFPLCAIDQYPISRPEPFPQETDSDTYCYLKIRAQLPSPSDNVCFSFFHPNWLAVGLGNACCLYGTEPGAVKYVRYVLEDDPSYLDIGAFISTSPVEWDCGPLPPEYDGKRNPNVKWVQYVAGTQGPMSKDPNNPTVLNIDLTGGIAP